MTADFTPLWRLVWITGASSGIGKAVALALARQGSTVIASARSADALARLETDAAGLPGRIVAWPLDVTCPDGVLNAFAEIISQLGAPDLVLLNAGTYVRNAPGEVRVEDFKTQADVNLMGVVHALAPTLDHFRARRKGHVAVVASLAGYRGLPQASAYGATKAALIHLCEALKTELHGSGVAISVINPGFVNTPLTDRNDFPMPFLISAEEAARAILDGLKRKRFEIAFPRRFALVLKLVRLLPYRIYFWLVRNVTRGNQTARESTKRPRSST